MKKIGKVLRLAGSVIGMLLALVVALYLIMLAVNWRDRPVGAAAARLEQVFRDVQEIAEADNAHLYLIGMGAVPEHRPSSRIKAGERLKSATAACKELDLACYQGLDSNAELIGQWLKQEAWLLEHYQVLVDRPGWRETGPVTVADSMEAVAAAIEGQRMLMQLAWTRAAAGDAAGVRQLLEKDARFWRMVFASSGDLRTKDFAARVFQEHFKWANLVLRKLPAGLQLQAVPQQWRMPVSLEERSLLRPVAAAQRQLARLLDDFAASPDRTSNVFYWLQAKLILPTVQRQDYLNRFGAVATAVSDTLNVPHASFPAALRQAQGLERKARDDAFDGWAYNPMGSLVMRRTPPNFSGYGARTADLEGTRRAALLTAELRAEGVDADQVASRLAGAALRDPYSDQPFAWDAQARAVVFTGLEPGQRGRHSILY